MVHMLKEAQAMTAVTYETGEKVRTWGGWYRHTRVMLNGVEIGRIQDRRRNKRNDMLTLRADALGGGCTIGHNVPWLVRCAQEGRAAA